MFDTFLAKITTKLAKAKNKLVLQSKLSINYLELDHREKEFIDHLLFQVKNNVSNVSTDLLFLNMSYLFLFGLA